ncbi:MotA/TolQ/ExbB proton channel family protein [Candidatus Haliotispira prima]|uniref:MotA/TolQ/ExbB proton channel family protein n=1 Tax=Candidatus Haliotispira prima TaxID=3034016 RepID=A0ABY8MI46_9SPIO|nr:MotA/TolQ/ExbB proton channel family protein [Candidatus Haliotispira prima]
MISNLFQTDNLQFWLLNAPFFALLLLLSICSVSLIIEKLLLLHRWRCRNKRLPTLAGNLLKEANLEQLSSLIEAEHGPEAILLRKSFYFIKHELEEPKTYPAQAVQNERSETPAPAFDSEYGPLARPIEPENPEAGTGTMPLLSLTGFHTEYHNRISRLEHRIETCIERLSLQLEKHSNLFHLIANVATLLGLLGTVTGMIYAFRSGALNQSAELAQGISQALITTAGGLIVAIPAIVSQQLFLNAGTMRIAGLEQLGYDILFFQHSRLDRQRSYLAGQQPDHHQRMGDSTNQPPGLRDTMLRDSKSSETGFPDTRFSDTGFSDPKTLNEKTLDTRVPASAHNRLHSSAKDLHELRQNALRQKNERLARMARQPISPASRSSQVPHNADEIQKLQEAHNPTIPKATEVRSKQIETFPAHVDAAHSPVSPSPTAAPKKYPKTFPKAIPKTTPKYPTSPPRDLPGDLGKDTPKDFPQSFPKTDHEVGSKADSKAAPRTLDSLKPQRPDQAPVREIKESSDLQTIPLHQDKAPNPAPAESVQSESTSQKPQKTQNFPGSQASPNSPEIQNPESKDLGKAGETKARGEIQEAPAQNSAGENNAFATRLAELQRERERARKIQLGGMKTQTPTQASAQTPAKDRTKGPTDSEEEPETGINETKTNEAEFHLFSKLARTTNADTTRQNPPQKKRKQGSQTDRDGGNHAPQ